MKLGILRIHFSFFALFLLLFMSDQTMVLVPFLLAAVLHEMGHLAALRYYEIPLRQITLTCLGGTIRADLTWAGYWQEMAISLSGPLVNFAAAYLSAQKAHYTGDLESAFLFAGANFLLGAVNLLPIIPLDGGCAIRALSYRLLGLETGDRVCRLISLCGAAMVTTGGIWLFARTQCNLSLLMLGLFLLFAQFRAK